MGEKMSIMSILSIFSRLLVIDWQQLTNLERGLGTKRFCYVFYQQIGDSLSKLQYQDTSLTRAEPPLKYWSKHFSWVV